MVYLPDGISYGTIAGTRHRTYIRCCLFSVQGGQKPVGRRHIQYCRSGKKGGYPYLFVPIDEYPLRRNTQRRSYTAHQYGRLGGDGAYLSTGISGPRKVNGTGPGTPPIPNPDNQQVPTPLGDVLIPLLLLASAYAVYKVTRRRVRDQLAGQ